MRIGIVGGGIMGLAAAWAARKAGHQVSVFEARRIPNPLGSSFDQHRLIRLTYGAAAGYCAMVMDAFAAWERMWRDLGQALYVETGTLLLEHADSGRLAQSAETLDRLGLIYDRFDASDIARDFPHIDPAHVETAVFVARGGVLLADRILTALAEWLRAAGVRLEEEAAVAGFDPEKLTLRLADGRVEAHDGLVVAAGPWSPRILPSLARRITPSRQIVVYVEPPRSLRAAWMASPTVSATTDAARLYMAPPVAGTALKIADHRFTLAGDPDREREVHLEELDAVLGAARDILAEWEDYRVTGGRSCFYSVAPEERFIVEPVGKAWVMAGFSGHGFKFGALMGELALDAVLGRRSPAEIGAYAAGRIVPQAPIGSSSPSWGTV